MRGTREEAERELAIRVTQLLDGKLRADERSVTLGAHVADWLDVQDRRISRKSVSSYRGLLEGHVLPMLGGFKVADLRTRQIDSLYKEKLAEGLSPRTVRYIHVVLRRCLEDAARWGLREDNPANHATPPRASRHKAQAWDPETARKFMVLLDSDPHPCGGVWRACITLGLRRGEALGLRWTDVDFQRRTVSVARSYGRNGDAGREFNPPKTASSRRTIAVDDWTLEWLAGLPRRDGSDLLFCGETGQPFDPDVTSKSFRTYLERHGLPRIRLHDLRHTHASLCLEAGVPLKVVSERLGHSGVQITADIYTHVGDTLHRETAGRVGDLLFSPHPED